MGPAITSYTPQLLELAVRGLADEDSEVKSNAAFLAGCLVQASSTDLSPQFGQIFGSLQGLFSVPDEKKESLRARDNACGAIARLMLKNQGAVPVDQVLPPVIAALPLQQDYEPYSVLFELFFQLASSGNQTFINNLDPLLVVFAQVLSTQTTAKTEAAQPLAASTHQKLLELIRALPQERVQAAGLAQYI